MFCITKTKDCPLGCGHDMRNCPHHACQYRTKPIAKLKLSQKNNSAQDVKATMDNLLLLICNSAKESGACQKDCCTSSKECKYCTTLADNLVDNGACFPKWTPASTPPDAYIPVLVEYAACYRPNDICSRLACISDAGVWHWWEGSANECSEDSKCVVDILRWMPIHTSTPPKKNLYDIAWFDTYEDEAYETETYYFQADKSLLRTLFPGISVTGECCIISMEVDTVSETVNLPICVGPAFLHNGMPIAQDWYDTDISDEDIVRLFNLLPKES